MPRFPWLKWNELWGRHDPSDLTKGCFAPTCSNDGTGEAFDCGEHAVVRPHAVLAVLSGTDPRNPLHFDGLKAGYTSNSSEDCWVPSQCFGHVYGGPTSVLYTFWRQDMDKLLSRHFWPRLQCVHLVARVGGSYEADGAVCCICEAHAALRFGNTATNWAGCKPRICANPDGSGVP